MYDSWHFLSYWNFTLSCLQICITTFRPNPTPVGIPPPTRTHCPAMYKFCKPGSVLGIVILTELGVGRKPFNPLFDLNESKAGASYIGKEIQLLAEFRIFDLRVSPATDQIVGNLRCQRRGNGLGPVLDLLIKSKIRCPEKLTEYHASSRNER
jgi:hypothetical protein